MPAIFLPRRHGFTMIELSIVLVIIGLVVGGLFSASTLIEQARARSVIAQKQRFDQAAIVFKDKYSYLPGDTRNPEAFNGVTRTKAAQHGDGNGLIEAAYVYGSTNFSACSERLLFWRDLVDTGLINDLQSLGTDGAASTADCVPTTLTPDSGLNNYLPTSTLGSGIYWMVTNQGNGASSTESADPKRHYYDFIGITSLATNGHPTPLDQVRTSMAYSIDNKMDDGLPLSGKVRATYANNAVPYERIWIAPTANCMSGSNYRLDSGGTFCSMRFDVGF